MPSLTLCADDFGLNRAVNEGIIQLVEAGRLNAVSCMAGGAEFAKGISALITACEKAPIPVEIGLHLTFTEYQPLGPMPRLAPSGNLPSVMSLLLKSHGHMLDGQELTDEMHRQWEHFVFVTGQSPDFIDGHQHIHLFPQLRNSVVSLAKSRFGKHGWVRSCFSDMAQLKKHGLSSLRVKIISHLAKKMYHRLCEAGIKTNKHFYGINDFNEDENFAGLMQIWMSLAAAQDEWAVIMCHPGLRSDDHAIYDPISVRRVDEFDYFSKSNSIYNLK